MADSHFTLDRLSPSSSSSSSSSSSKSGVGTVCAKVNQIQVQPRCVSKDKKPILDYDSNHNFYPPEFNDSYTLTGTAAIQQVNNFDDSSVSPEQVFMDDFTIVTQENSGQFPKETQENIGQFPQTTQENTNQCTQANQENTNQFTQATPDNHGHFNKLPPLDRG
jgi:hypothetical protein